MDKKYCNNFYKNHDLTFESSDFSKFVLNYIRSFNKTFNILDVGCGNGRDSYYLSKEHTICGCDISNKPEDKDNCTFTNDNMITVDKSNYNLVYSRFTFHSITDEDQDLLLASIKTPTILCIETRSIKGSNSFRTFGDNHYRNFTDIDELKKLLKKYKFEILYIKESNNFAVYKDENPICIRVICKNY